MISSLLIIAVSAVLFVYWFRYTSLLILRTKTAEDYTAEVASANNLCFPHVQDRLRADSAAAGWDSLEESLARDYRLLTYLFRHAADFQVGGCPIEQRVLMIDFRLMQVWYKMTRRFAAPRAKQALEEMSQILGYLANEMGQRSAAVSNA